jgi:hypothetical protein
MEKSLDENIVVMGNGPSLKNDIVNHLEIFKNAHLAVVNHFCLSEFFFELKPRSYFLLDPDFFTDASGFKGNVGNTFAILTGNIEWEIDFYVPYKFRKSLLVKRLKENSRFKVYFVNYVPAKGGFTTINHLLYNWNLATPQCQNVLIFTLFILTRKSTKNIFLFGAENDWHVNVIVNKDNFLELRDRHLYSENKEIKPIVLLNGNNRRTMAELLESSVKVFRAYMELEKYAQKRNVNIYNCSGNSMIDAFERLDNEEFKQKLHESSTY